MGVVPIADAKSYRNAADVASAAAVAKQRANLWPCRSMCNVATNAV